jgi:2-haloacid dehalogenase
MGTVVDVDGSIQERLAVILDRHGRTDAEHVTAEWDRHIRAGMDDINNGDTAWSSHLSLRHNALQLLIDTGDLPALTDAERDDLVTIIGRLQAWPDSPAALTALSKKVRIVAFSNADLAELVALSKNAELRWHAVISAQFAHAYKPHESVYQAALEMLELDPERTMVVAAHPWDLRAAALQGMQTAHITRPHTEGPSPEDHFTITATDLADLNDQLTPAMTA